MDEEIEFLYHPVGKVVRFVIANNHQNIELTLKGCRCADGNKYDYWNALCTDGSPATCCNTKLTTTSFQDDELTYYEIVGEHEIRENDRLIYSSPDSVLCVSNPDFEWAIQVDIELPHTQTFYGYFSKEGVHSVLAVLESYSGGKVATLKIEVSVQVVRGKSPTVPTSGLDFQPISGITLYEEINGNYRSGCGMLYNHFEVDTRIKFGVNFLRKNGCGLLYTIIRSENPNDILSRGWHTHVHADRASMQSIEYYRFFVIESSSDHINTCRNFNSRTDSSLANLETFSNIIMNAVELTILGESGSYHTIYLENGDVCLSPDLMSKPETPAVLTANMSSFSVKVVSLGSGNAIELQGGQKNICIPQGQIRVNQLYSVVVYGDKASIISRKSTDIIG
ncbi:hypothetical protein ACTXT7_015018 [Hymenolepis weldensis]